VYKEKGEKDTPHKKRRPKTLAKDDGLFLKKKEQGRRKNTGGNHFLKTVAEERGR